MTDRVDVTVVVLIVKTIDYTKITVIERQQMRSFVKTKPVKSKKYMQFIREQTCMICMQHKGECDPHHHQKKGEGGMGTKCSDLRCVPLCHRHHNDIHTMGKQSFMRHFGLEETNFEHAIQYYNEKWRTDDRNH